MNYSFIVSTQDGRANRCRLWTTPQLGLLLKCKIWGYTHLQCAEVIEHYFHSRTEGRHDRVASHVQDLRKELEGGFHDYSFDAWVKLHNVPPKQVEEINSRLANWTTLKTHEGVLLKLLLASMLNQKSFDLRDHPHSEELYYIRHLQELIPDQPILPTLNPPKKLTRDILVTRVRETISLFKQYEPPLMDGSGRWKEEAIEDWIKAWKVEEVVTQIFDNVLGQL